MMAEEPNLTSSSSNRRAGACDALVMHRDRQVGVIRLPESRAYDFADQFNRTYRSIGLKLVPLVPPATKTKKPHQQLG